MSTKKLITGKLGIQVMMKGNDAGKKKSSKKQVLATPLETKEPGTEPTEVEILGYFLTKKDAIKENSHADKPGGSIAQSGDDPSKMSFSNADGQSETGSRLGTNESFASESGAKLTSKIPHHNSDYTLYCFENAKHKCENFIHLIEHMKDLCDSFGCLCSVQKST